MGRADRVHRPTASRGGLVLGVVACAIALLLASPAAATAHRRVPRALPSGALVFTGVEPSSGATFLRLFRVAARGGRARSVFTARPIAADGAPLGMERPAFAPDGTALAYSAYELGQGAPYTGPPAIGLATWPGLTRSLLTPPTIGRDDYPAWAGNDTVIFSRGLVTPTPGVRLFKIARNGGAATQVAASDSPSADIMAAVSRGGKLAFVRVGSGANGAWYSYGQNRGAARVVIAGPDGSVTRELPGSRCEWPSWSPGATALVYDCGAPYGRHALYLVRADGTGLRRLTNGRFDDTTPAWSPDGRWIAFARGKIGAHHAIYVMPARGGTAIRVTGRDRAFTDAQQPAWQPATTAGRAR
ncbi:MAG: hypothetical protein U0T02_00895 [Solirubrobacteraceae bacterium]